ncbi:MAG: glycosyltransferase 87 family protein, partial [Thermoplasmata archaeon]
MEKIDDIKSNQNLDLLNLPPLSKIVILILYFIVLGFTVVFGVYIATYFLFIVLFLFVASSLGGYKIIDKFLSLPIRQKILLIFLIALLLRWVMLFQTQVITHDIETYVRRSKWMLEGNIPYRDFYGGNKPPLYEFMLYFMGLTVTPGVIQFRAVFSVFDALIPIVLFFICSMKYNDRFAIVASLSYALFPISIITVGLSGHYDSVVALFSLISILLLFKNKLNFSGLSLGLAFALKIYPIVLLPFFISTVKTWKERILYVVFFLIPTIVADGVLYLISPSAFFEYIREESAWEGSSAFSSNIEMVINSAEIFSIKIS